MTDKAWKKMERRVAREVGTERTPLSGGNGKQTRSDTLHEKYYIEAKQRKKIPFFAEFKRTIMRAKKEGKIPMVIFHQKFAKENILMIRLSDFISLTEDTSLEAFVDNYDVDIQTIPQINSKSMPDKNKKVKE
jgi:hypothetical protein